jgi:Domain of unknown function (DUF3303)
MQFMVIERFKNGDAAPIYERFRAHGRLAPATLRYVDSWVSQDTRCCYQVMDGTREDLERWMAAWADLVDFEVIPVISSAEAAARYAK